VAPGVILEKAYEEPAGDGGIPTYTYRLVCKTSMTVHYELDFRGSEKCEFIEPLLDTN
jgi:hypothetical protein